MVTVDKRETNRISVNMEKEGFIRTMDALLPVVSLKEICTDGHVQIAALMSNKRYNMNIYICVYTCFLCL